MRNMRLFSIGLVAIYRRCSMICGQSTWRSVVFVSKRSEWDIEFLLFILKLLNSILNFWYLIIQLLSTSEDIFVGICDPWFTDTHMTTRPWTSNCWFIVIMFSLDTWGSPADLLSLFEKFRSITLASTYWVISVSQSAVIIFIIFVPKDRSLFIWCCPALLIGWFHDWLFLFMPTIFIEIVDIAFFDCSFRRNSS